MRWCCGASSIAPSEPLSVGLQTICSAARARQYGARTTRSHTSALIRRRSLMPVDVVRAAGRGHKHASMPRVFVCIAVQLRTFLEPSVQSSLARMLHHDGYEYVLSVDQPVQRNESRLQIGLLAITAQRFAWEAFATFRRYAAALRSQLVPCASNSSHRHRIFYPLAKRIEPCYAMLEAEEQARSILYDYVARVRPDHMFSRRVPHVSVLLNAWAHGRNLLLMDDQIGVTTRQHAKTLFLAPLRVYSSCATANMWSHTCNVSEAAAKSTMFRPPFQACITMGLVTWFSSESSTWMELDSAPCTVNIRRPKGFPLSADKVRVAEAFDRQCRKWDTRRMEWGSVSSKQTLDHNLSEWSPVFATRAVPASAPCVRPGCGAPSFLFERPQLS